MNEKKKSNALGCVTFLFYMVMFVTFLVLLIIRASGTATFSWWYVFLPLIAAFGLPCIMLCFGLLMAMLDREEDE